jgi:AbrB family looped-hinge helix DNA binding protein
LDAVTVKVDKNGAFIIPREMREALGIPTGREIRLFVQDGELRGSTRLTTLRAIQRALRSAGCDGPALTYTLAAERRSDAAREEAEAKRMLGGADAAVGNARQ